MIELFIEGQAVDVAPDTKITLNFESNLFGDISKITASNSFTIALPKTAKNNRIFAMPSVVGGMSNAPYRKWGAQLFVNGVSVIDTAYAMLLSVGEDYEIALYWGVVRALANLKDGGKSLKELSKVLKITYGGDKWWQDWETKTDATGQLINAKYECGIEDLPNNTSARREVALLPSVRGSWLWDNIVADNALTIHTPSEFDSWLKHIAVPFVGRKATTEEDNYTTQYKKINIVSRFSGSKYIGATFHTPTETAASDLYETKTEQIHLSLGGKKMEFDATTFYAKVEHKCIISGTVSASNNAYLSIQHYANGGWSKSEEIRVKNNTATITKEYELEVGDRLCLFVRNEYATTEMSVSGAIATYKAFREDEYEQLMGGKISTKDNLPDIKQIDFVKATMAMQGLWATLIDGEVHLQSVADFYNEAQPTLDWSHKLIGSGDGDAKKTTYTLANYVQRNNLRYKEDDTVKVDASGVLIVENDNLDNTKDMLTLPFSASDGNSIPHLSLEDGKVKEQKVQPRIMLLTEKNDNGKWRASLDFDNFTSQYGEEMPSLRFSRLLSAYYGDWQRVIRNPIVIEEQMNLTEIDIKELDYRKPIYLQKYGARFAVQKVQWSEGDASVVTLVYLPPKEDIAVALPYKVTTGVTFGKPMSLGTNDPKPSWDYLVSGAGDYFGENARLYFDEAKASTDLGIGFVAWTTEAGNILSTDNPFVYDGSNGDMVIYANTQDEFVVE